MDKELLKQSQNNDIWEQCRIKFLQLRKSKLNELLFVLTAITLLFNGFTIFWQMRNELPNAILLMTIITTCIIFVNMFMYIFVKRIYKEVPFEKKIIVVKKADIQINSILLKPYSEYIIVDTFDNIYKCKFKDIYEQMLDGYQYAILISNNKIYGFAKID